MNVLVFGAGAVGATVGGWLSEKHPRVWLLDLPAVAQHLEQHGLTLYLGGAREQARRVPVQAVSDLSAPPRPDVVIVAVKTYSLDKVAGLIKDRLGDVLVLALQNGVDNQTILPRHFSKVIYGIVAYNAWIDEPGVVGYQKRGPLVIGTPAADALTREKRELAALLNDAVETVVTDRFQDAAHSKMVINLTNSLQALIGHPLQPISDRALFQKVLTNVTWEGVQIVKAAGHEECRLGGMPPWWLMRAAATLPQALTRRAFEKNVKKMVMSSMAQDVLQRGGADSELETLNGYFIKLADQHGVAAPYNRALYALCKERFGKPGFKPMGIDEVYAAVARS